jgi:hypothetical protein
MKLRAPAVFMAALAVSCGAPLMKLPSGPGAPMSAADAAALLAGATTTCRGIRTLTAEIGVGGSAAGHRVRGRLLAGVAAPASARLEAVAPFGQPIFIFTAVGDKATLLLPRDRRVLKEAPPADVLDAVAGVPLDAADLFTTLTGCAPAASDVQGEAFGDGWRAITAAGPRGTRTVYLRRDDANQPWRIVAVLRADVGDRNWRAEYREQSNGLPRSIHLAGGGAQSPDRRFNITLALSQIETNMTLDPEAFTIQIPADTDVITLEELRESSPLAPSSDGR